MPTIPRPVLIRPGPVLAAALGRINISATTPTTDQDVLNAAVLVKLALDAASGVGVDYNIATPNYICAKQYEMAVLAQHSTMSGFTNRAQPSTVQQILESHVAQYTKDMAALHASLGAGEDAEEREKNKADRQRLKEANARTLMLEGEEANLMDVANAEGVYGTHLNLALPCCDAKCEIMSLTVEEVQLWFDHFEISDPEPTDQNLEAARTVLLGCFVAGL